MTWPLENEAYCTSSIIMGVFSSKTIQTNKTCHRDRIAGGSTIALPGLRPGGLKCTELQIRRGMARIQKVIFLISQQYHML